MSDVAIGDRVKIKSGYYAGWTGEVIDRYTVGHFNIAVEVRGDTVTGPVYYAEDELERV